MPVDEHQRHALYESVRSALGDSSAGTLMQLLPPVEGAQIATQADLDAQTELLRRDFRAEIGHLRGEFGELRGEFGELRGEVRAEIGQLRGEFKEELARQTRTTMVSMAGLMVGTAGIAIAAAQLAT